MKKNILIILCIYITFVKDVYSGVWVLIKTPDAISGIVSDVQARIAHKITCLNQNNETMQFVFEEPSFKQHISLAFVTQDQLSVEKTIEQYPGIKQILDQAAQHNSAVDITDDLTNLSLDKWDGTFEVECGGKKTKNYLNLVLKMRQNKSLEKLAINVRDLLLKNYDMSTKFAFSVHFTLGKVCEKNNRALNDWKECINLTDITIPTFNSINPIILDTFSLSGHDGSEIEFHLH